MRRLLLALTEPPARFRFRLAWSRWRRHQQATAKRAHRARRARRLAVAAPASALLPLPARKPSILPAVPAGGITAAQWHHLAPLLPTPRRQGRPLPDRRRMITALRWVEQTGRAWRALPARFGPWQAVYQR
ncbi:MAG: transposase [Chloroflexota bacterium]